MRKRNYILTYRIYSKIRQHNSDYIYRLLHMYKEKARKTTDVLTKLLSNKYTNYKNYNLIIVSIQDKW